MISHYTHFCLKATRELLGPDFQDIIGIDAPMRYEHDLFIKYDRIIPYYKSPEYQDEEFQIAQEILKMDHKYIKLLASHYYEAFPEVCDISSDFISDLFCRKFYGDFSVYRVCGECHHVGHWWNILISEKTGNVFIVDFTRAQFNKNFLSRSTWTASNGKKIVRRNFNKYKKQICESDSFWIPFSLITLSSEAKQYHGIEYWKCSRFD